jgi:hypothetical protein
VPERESIEELQDVAYVLLFEVEATIYSRVSMDFVAPPCFFVVIGYMFYPRPGILAPIIQQPSGPCHLPRSALHPKHIGE